ncbi:MAG: hypothetical protein M0004_08070 [Actinomycetota bacterium]|nr:hypothetical protein [Actinomycetota bacterium]
MRRIIAFASTHDINAIALHRNDIVDLVVYPGCYFGATKSVYRSNFERYQDSFEQVFRSPTRGDRPTRARTYLRCLIEEAGAQGISVYLENKELYFDDTIVHQHPEVVIDGRICASSPFWTGFVHNKYTELTQELPGLAGIIVSPGTAESRVSIASNQCSCDSCKSTSEASWYLDILGAMQRPLEQAGMELVVRDFSFTSGAHGAMVDTVATLPSTVGISFKNTPHDFYPTFPHNARIGTLVGRQQWVEIDCMGQFYGWGIAPSLMLLDIRDRLSHAANQGVSGVIFRSDWEGLEGHSSMDTLNRFNLCVGALLSRTPSMDDQELCAHFLDESVNRVGIGVDQHSLREASAWCAAILPASWTSLRRALFSRDCVFSESSCLPVSIADALWVGNTKDSLADWDPSAIGALAPTPHNADGLCEEADSAITSVRESRSALELAPTGVPTDLLAELRSAWGILEDYVVQFALAVKAVHLGNLMMSRKSRGERITQHVAERLASVLGDLTRHADLIAQRYRLGDYSYPTHMLLDPERISVLVESIRHDVEIA